MFECAKERSDGHDFRLVSFRAARARWIALRVLRTMCWWQELELTVAELHAYSLGLETTSEVLGVRCGW